MTEGREGSVTDPARIAITRGCCSPGWQSVETGALVSGVPPSPDSDALHAPPASLMNHFAATLASITRGSAILPDFVERRYDVEREPTRGIAPLPDARK